MVEPFEAAVASPWVYLALFGLAVLDAFFPVVPAETLVITAGAFAASGRTNLAWVILSAAAGAFVGDNVSYQIGRLLGRSGLSRMRPGSRRRATYDWAVRALDERGGLVLVIGRYIPGGRTAATLTTGAVGYPWWKFALFDAIAAASWAVYSGVIGFVGGTAFRDSPVKGLLLGFGIAVAITAVVELVRFLRRRGNKRSQRWRRPGR